MTRHLQVALGAVFACVILVPTAWTAEADSAGIQVHYDRALVTIQVTQETSLASVLERFCQETRIECEGVQLASELRVAPMVVSGTWRDVVSQLLEGSDLGYVARPPAALQHGKLLIMVQSRKGEPSPSSPLRESADGARKAQSKELDYQRSNAHSAPDPASGAEANPAEEIGSGTERSNDLSPSQDYHPSAPSFGFRGTGPTDSHGIPITNFGGPAIEPMPDGTGRPIFVAPGSPAFEPFPDGNGRLIPVVPAPIAFEPFPGKDGKPIPVIFSAPR